MGAVRLSIIDLQGGNQPVSSDDGDTVLVFNGEIYNHAALRQELEALGHRFRSRCDSEVVLRAFLQWDTECFAKFRGMFALALWQDSARRLLLARDRLGIKPLYVYRHGRDLHFGSELKAILGHPHAPRQLHTEALQYYLSLNYVPFPYTLVRGIEKLQPGSWLEWRDGTLRSAPYWKLEFRERQQSLEDAKEELHGLLRDSVREHLISDVPLGVWASGGMDSSTILHYAAQQVPKLKTFSVSFQGRSFDESRYFREVAQFYGAEHHELDLNPSLKLCDAIEQIPYYADEPSADAGALPVWFLSQMTRQSVKVALSGEGADELFGGYYTYLADQYARVLRQTPAALRRAGLAMLQWLPVSDEKISFEYKAKRLLAGSLLSPEAAHFYWNGTFSAKERAKLLKNGARPVSLEALVPEAARQAGFLNRYLWTDQLCYLPDDILSKCDRMSMAHSLEVRPPFLDHRIVEFAASLPEKMKVRGSKLKVILRELMRDQLPPSVLNRKKEGFDIPTHEWFRGPLRNMLFDIVNQKAVSEAGCFHWPEIERLLRLHQDRKANLGYHLWGLLILFLWIRTWAIRP